MSKQTTKQIAFAAIISLLFIFLLAGLIIYHHPTVSHATSTTESGNGKEIEWYFELERNDKTGEYQATHIYTEDASLEGILRIPHTLNGYPVTSIGRGIEKNPVIPADADVTEIAIPDSVTIYEDYAFYQLSNVQKIYRVQTKEQLKREPTYEPYLNVLDSEILTEVGYRAFMGCSSLDCMYIPNRKFEIKEEAFADCTGLKTVYVGHQVTLQDSVFKGCSGLSHLEIDQEQIGNQFQDCGQIESIVFGKNVDSIQSDAFRLTRQESIVLNAGSASQQYIYSNNRVKSEKTYDAQKVSDRDIYFLNPNTTIEHTVYADFSEQSYKVEQFGMLFPEYTQEFSGKAYGTISVPVYYNVNTNASSCQTYTSLVKKTNAVTLKPDATGQNITDFEITTDSATADEGEAVPYTCSNSIGDRFNRTCYPVYQFTAQECLNIYDLYKEGIANNRIYLSGDATRSSVKQYSDDTKMTTYSIVPEEGSAFLQDTDLQNWWHDYCSTQKIEETLVPSYLCESQYVESSKAYDVRYMTARYHGSVQEDQLLNPSQLKIDISTQSIANSLHLDGTDSRIFYITKDDLKRQSSALTGNEFQLFAQPDMDYYDAYSESDLGFPQDCFDYRYYDYSLWQRFFHVADYASENQLFFSDDSTNRILSIQGMNEVRADALEEEAVEGYTEIYVFYIAGFRKVGTGGTYEKENTKYILAATQEDAFENPKEEGLFNEEREYVGLGGSFRWDEAQKRYIYDVTGEYAPVICKTTCQIYTTPADKRQAQNFEEQIENLNEQLTALSTSYQELMGQVMHCDQAFDDLSQVLGSGYTESTQLTLEQKSEALIARSESVRQELNDYQQSLFQIASNLNELAKNIQSDESFVDNEQQEISPDQALELIAKTNQMVITTGEKFEQLNEKIEDSNASLQLVNGIIGALNLAEKSSNEEVLHAVIKLYQKNQENEKLLADQKTVNGSITSLQDQVTSLSATKSSLEQQVNQEQGKAKLLSTQIQTLQANISELQQKNIALNDQVILLKTENQTLKQKLESGNDTEQTGETSVPDKAEDKKQTNTATKKVSTKQTSSGTKKQQAKTDKSSVNAVSTPQTSSGKIQTAVQTVKNENAVSLPAAQTKQGQTGSSDTDQRLPVQKNTLPVSYSSNSIRQLTDETTEVIEAQTAKSSAAIKPDQSIPKNRITKTQSGSAVTQPVTLDQPATKQDAFPKEVDAKDVFSMKAVIGILSTVGMIVIGIWTAKCLMRRKRKVKKYV